MESGSSANTIRSCPFLRRQSSKRTYSDMNTSHRIASENTNSDSLFVPADADLPQEHTSRRRRLSPFHDPSPARFPGDGLDYRRPIMSRPQSHVIDLTDENDERREASSAQASAASWHPELALPSSRAQRLPRYERNIISIAIEEDEEAERGRDTGESSDSQSTLQNAYQERHPRYSVLRRPSHRIDRQMNDRQERSTTTIRESRTIPNHLSALPRSITPHASNMDEPIDLTEDNDDDVVHVNTRPLPGINTRRPDPGVWNARIAEWPPQFPAPDFGTRLFQRFMTFGDEAWAEDRQRHIRENDARRHTRPTNPAPARPPGRDWLAGLQNIQSMMNYGAPAFDIGIPGGDRPPAPNYEPPSEPAAGFTRSPGEDEIVVCPNCGDELAVGPRGSKQEVWVLKACGHAYCGDCAQSGTRSRKTQKPAGKGKGKVTEDTLEVPPLKVCVVDGCSSKVTKTSIIRIYSS